MQSLLTWEVLLEDTGEQHGQKLTCSSVTQEKRPKKEADARQSAMLQSALIQTESEEVY